MKRIILFSAFLFTGLCVLTSCFKINKFFNPEMRRVNGSKLIVSDTTHLERFHSVRIDNFAVELIQDTVDMLIITADDNVIPELHVKNENGRLRVDFSEHIMMSMSQPVKMRLHFKDIDELVNEYSQFTCDGTIALDRLYFNSQHSTFEMNLEVDTLEALISSSGRCHSTLEVTGNAGYSNIVLEKRGWFRGLNMTGNEFNISYDEDAYYLIKLKNFEQTNVLLPTNRILGPEVKLL